LQGRPVKIQGLLTPPLQATPISATKLYHSAKGNDTWAFAIVDAPSTEVPGLTEPLQPAIQNILHQYEDVFQEPS